MDRIDEYIRNCLQKLEVPDIRGATNELYKVSKTCQALLGNASDAEAEKFVKQMTRVLNLYSTKLEALRNEDPTHGNSSEDKDPARFLLMDIYRILRTSCFTSKVQELFGRLFGPKLMADTQTILSYAKDIYTGEQLTQSISIAVQFLSNLASGCPYNQDMVWDSFCPIMKLWIDQTMNQETDRDKEKWVKVVNLVCAVVDNCLPRMWQRDSSFIEREHNFALMVAIIDANTIWVNLDFGKKAMKSLVQVPGLFKKTLRHMKPENTMAMLYYMEEVIMEWRTCDESEGTAPTIVNNLQYLVEQLVVNHRLLNADVLANPWENQVVSLHQLVRMLEVISIATCCTSYAPELSEFKVVIPDFEPTSLLRHTLRLFHDVHEKGKQSYNYLSMVKMEERAVDPAQPSYLLRRDLIRIIGNLAYKNKTNQDLIRTAEGGVIIPQLFENTNIDLRNPYLQEWAKLALCNIVRDNEENAKFVQGLKLQGTVDPTGVLRECGLTLQTQGNKVVISQSDSVPNLAKLAEKAPSRRNAHSS